MIFKFIGLFCTQKRTGVRHYRLDHEIPDIPLNRSESKRNLSQKKKIKGKCEENQSSKVKMGKKRPLFGCG